MRLKVVSPVEELNARTAPQLENGNQTGRFNSHLNCSQPIFVLSSFLGITSLLVALGGGVQFLTHWLYV